MGKQVQVAMLDADEAQFLAFLRETTEIQLLENFAPTPDQIFVERMLPREQGYWSYYIWNKAFPWQPEFRYVRADAPIVEHRGWAYVANAGTAPLIEYTRHKFAPRGVRGRVYWSKLFSAPNGLDYDSKSFERWYDSIARWLRKHGRRKDEGRHSLLYMPHAWADYGATP